MGIDVDDLKPTLVELVTKGFNVLAWGPPGTGKTSLAHEIGRKSRGKQPLSYQCHEESSQSELMIQYLPSPEGGVLVMNGVAADGWLDGNMVVFDEINHLAGSPAMSTFYRIMDDPKLASFRMPDGSVIKPQEGFSVWATMNGDPSEDLPEAVRDRFHLSICMWMPTGDMVASLPEELRNLPSRAYRDPNNPFPTFRDIKNFGECCKVMGVCPADTADQQVQRIAKMIWGPKWTEALHTVDAANRADDEGE
jgi:hypothetical protein